MSITSQCSQDLSHRLQEGQSQLSCFSPEFGVLFSRSMIALLHVGQQLTESLAWHLATEDMWP